MRNEYLKLDPRDLPRSLLANDAPAAAKLPALRGKTGIFFLLRCTRSQRREGHGKRKGIFRARIREASATPAPCPGAGSMGFAAHLGRRSR